MTLSRTPEYSLWYRLNNQYCKEHDVQEEWSDFATFLSDVGKRPEGAWFRRYDLSIGYVRGNCFWATKASYYQDRYSKLVGQTFGKQHVLRVVSDTSVEVECMTCGNIHTLIFEEAQKGREHCQKCCNIKHGMYGTREYASWSAMMQRCNNPNNTKYFMYGARGVRVCDEWLSFENFYRDMGDRPQGTTLDKDKLGDGLLYSKETCCWLTPLEQAQHTRKKQ